MKVQDILKAKGMQVHTISVDASLEEVVQSLVAHNCGSLIVSDQDRPVGIVTERDILRTVAGDARRLSQIPVTEKMSKDLVMAFPADDLPKVMGMMTDNHIRHLPILDDFNGGASGELVGIISIGDVVKAQRRHLARENAFLRDYIQG